MNQILFYEKSKNTNYGKMGTAKISAIVILVFAILMIGKGVLGIVKTSSGTEEPVVATRQTDDGLEMKIEYTKTIDKIVYSWNNGETATLQGKGRTEITETVEMPVGTSVLNLVITDIDKKTFNYNKQYYREETEDTTKPTIELTPDGSKLKITVTDNKELESVKYHWNEEDETVITPRDDSKKLIEEKIAILKGENTLTVVAIDKAGNEQTKTETYKGAKKPKVEIAQNGNVITIKATDEENIKKIELNINGELFSTDSANTGASLNMQVAEIQQTLQSGENEVIVTVYNVSGLSVTETKKITI